MGRNFSSTVWYTYPDIFQNVWFFRWNSFIVFGNCALPGHFGGLSYVRWMTGYTQTSVTQDKGCRASRGALGLLSLYKIHTLDHKGLHEDTATSRFRTTAGRASADRQSHGRSLDKGKYTAGKPDDQTPSLALRSLKPMKAGQPKSY
jgi:hypothetical protein